MSKRRQKTSARLFKSISMPGKAPMNTKFSRTIRMTSYSTFRREHSKGRQRCETTLCVRLSLRSLAMYIPFGTWPTLRIWSRWNGVLKPCTKVPLAKSRQRARRFRSLAAPSTNTTSEPERFRRDGFTSILLPFCARLARERKRNRLTSSRRCESLGGRHGSEPLFEKQ